MKVCTNDFTKYVIIPNQFVDYQEINEQLFKTVDATLTPLAEEYRTKKEEEFTRAREKRYKQLCWWQLALIRSRIRKHGGVDLDGN